MIRSLEFLYQKAKDLKDKTYYGPGRGYLFSCCLKAYSENIMIQSEAIWKHIKATGALVER